MKRAVLYLRVSTVDQTTANQERELRQIAERVGYDLVKVYKDHGISGAKRRDQRPAFNSMCRAAARREFDVVMAWSVDRLGRSLQDLIGFLSELHALGIDLFLHQQGLDTTTPAGKAMFQMMGVFAEFERSIIQERVRAGVARAKSEGKQTPRSKSESARLYSGRRGPVCAALPSSSASASAQCSGSAALSWRQASPCRAPKTAAMTQKRPLVRFGPPPLTHVE